ncbi:MAG: type II secretion system inner membrane protein GspF [Deltaproteobacteria bacterium]|nr:type II secretion system inner membrane protein GspF [Deltaproteobacteria bacterium]MBI3389947.1 type II secretion system inner membrane protein GspF [Deltaproteobacteria bacterium]
MPVYAYKGLTTEGKAVNGIVDADSPKGARLKLRKSGVFPTDLSEDRTGRQAAEEKAATPGARFQVNIGQLFERITPQDVALMTRQLSTLVGAGLPLVDCLSALIEQIDNAPIKRTLSQVRGQVVEGRALADAMKEHPKLFSDLYVNMVRAGEASGALDIVLLRLAEYTEKAAQLRNKVRSALTYPVAMGLVSSSVLLFLLSYVVPRITKIFDENKQALPLMTTILLRISGFLQQYWWLIVGAAIAIVMAIRVSIRTPAGRLRFDGYVLRVPYFGKMLKKVALARFSRTLSTLLNSGIALLPSLDIVKNVVGNTVLAEAIENGRNSIREGQSIEPPLRKSGLFPPLVLHMIAVGEKSGELEEMLSRAADAYDNEVDASVNALTSILEPVMIIFMGGIVLFIVMAILVPIFELQQLVR